MMNFLALLLFLAEAMMVAVAEQSDLGGGEPPKSATTTDPAIRVAYAGFARSGTRSLAAALERLGYQPCDDSEITQHRDESHHQELMKALIRHDIPSIIHETAQIGCDATMELHAPFWRDIMQASPETKIVFIVREFEPWLESVQTMLRSLAPLTRYPLRFIPVLDLHYRYLLSVGLAISDRDNPPSLEEAHQSITDPGSPEQKKHLKQVHEKFVAEANEISRQQPERALLLDLNEGYPQLCHFLEIADCPDGEFPYLNTRDDTLQYAWMLRGLEAVLYVLPLLALWAGYKLTRLERSSRDKAKTH